MNNKSSSIVFWVVMILIIGSCGNRELPEPKALLNYQQWKGDKIAEKARSETVIKSSEEDQKWWGKVDNTKLVNAIFDAVYSARTTAYHFVLNTPLSVEEVKNIEFVVDTTYVENLETGELEQRISTTDVRKHIVKLFFQEDWYFDEENLKLYKDVKGITLLVEKYTEAGEFIGYKPLFNVYFDGNTI